MVGGELGIGSGVIADRATGRLANGEPDVMELVIGELVGVVLVGAVAGGLVVGGLVVGGLVAGGRNTTEFPPSEYAAPLAMAAAPGSNIRCRDISRAVTNLSLDVAVDGTAGMGAPKPVDGVGEWCIGVAVPAGVAARWTAASEAAPEE